MVSFLLRILSMPSLPSMFVLLAAPVVAPAPALVTLDEALQTARSANTALPIAGLEKQAADEKLREARAERWMKVAIDGDFVYAPPGGYDPVVTNAGEARLQITAHQPIYDGGARRAAVSKADAEREAATARYRIAEKDLDVEVRSRFAEWLEADSEIAVRRAGIERLKTYRTSLQSRRAAGQGIAADLLKTDVRLGSDEAEAIDAESRREEASAELNVLMGRPPATPLELAPLPMPSTSGSGLARLPEPETAETAPEVVEAEALARGAEADVRTAEAERRPHLFASGDAGWWGSDTTRWSVDRWRRDAGFSLGLQVSWLLWDFGAARARVSRARLDSRRARLEVTAREREASLELQRAFATASALERQIAVLSRAEPSARDAYLDAESRYRGGSATSLEVLEAYSAAVDASVKLAQAVSRLRIARALEQRWGTP
jgi:OMF family outer membrane factor